MHRQILGQAAFQVGRKVAQWRLCASRILWTMVAHWAPSLSWKVFLHTDSSLTGLTVHVSPDSWEGQLDGQYAEFPLEIYYAVTSCLESAFCSSFQLGSRISSEVFPGLEHRFRMGKVSLCLHPPPLVSPQATFRDPYWADLGRSDFCPKGDIGYSQW